MVGRVEGDGFLHINYAVLGREECEGLEYLCYFSPTSDGVKKGKARDFVFEYLPALCSLDEVLNEFWRLRKSFQKTLGNLHPIR